MTTAMLEATGNVECTQLSDGMIVRLYGTLGEEQLSRLRLALLTPLRETCRDVVVDAGGISDVSEPALAVLLAAREWAEQHGARFLLSRSAACLDEALAQAGLDEALPRLAALGGRRAPRLLPAPRPATD